MWNKICTFLKELSENWKRNQRNRTDGVSFGCDVFEKRIKNESDCKLCELIFMRILSGKDYCPKKTR